MGQRGAYEALVYKDGSIIIAEDSSGSEYCYRIIVKTDSAYIRWTVIGRNLNANY